MVVPNSCSKDVHKSNMKAVERPNAMYSEMAQLAIQPGSRAAVYDTEMASGIWMDSDHLIEQSKMLNR